VLCIVAVKQKSLSVWKGLNDDFYIPVCQPSGKPFLKMFIQQQRMEDG
jgi:hypothetical protein